MVVEQGGVGARMIVEQKKQLEASGVRILGAVLNKVKMSGSGYYGHYYKRYYGKYYSNEADEKGRRRKRKNKG
jgi:Mrp family chromosome partitioning ATPase